MISGRDSNDPLYESYRWIRTQFDLIDHIRHKRLQSLLITSAGPDEGKSTTVANLGISVAREGKKVVLVDTDLRRPSLDTYFDVANKAGLAEWLQGKCSLDKCIRETRISNLSVIPSGQPFPDPGTLLESQKMGQLMSQLQTRYDLVILDSAPLLIKTDALALARCIQGSVIVLESEKTTRRALCELMEVIAVAPLKPLGFVLNKCPVRRGEYRNYQYYNGNRRRRLLYIKNLTRIPCEESAGA